MAIKKQETKTQEVAETTVKVETPAKDENVKSLKELVSKVKSAAMKTRVVTLTYNNPIDNAQVTTAYLSCENLYFHLDKVVPLNVPVELEQCLIDCAKDAKITIHVPEVIDGKPTGNSRYRSINKYSISYGE